MASTRRRCACTTAARGSCDNAGKKKGKEKNDAWLSPTDIDGLVRRVPDNGMVFLCNPNNPTGELLTRRQVREILDAAASAGSCHVLVDECFIEMSRSPARVSHAVRA